MSLKCYLPLLSVGTNSRAPSPPHHSKTNQHDYEFWQLFSFSPNAKTNTDDMT